MMSRRRRRDFGACCFILFHALWLQAYKKLALLLHPDKCHESGAEEVSASDFKFFTMVACFVLMVPL